MNAPNASMARFIRFAVVGVFGAGVYLVGARLLHQHARLSLQAAATVLFVPVVLINYVLHYSWTFGSRKPHGSVAPRFVSIAVGAMGINYVVVALGTRWLQVSQTVILVLCGLIVAAWNYLLSRFWVFVDYSRRQ